VLRLFSFFSLLSLDIVESGAEAGKGFYEKEKEKKN
jgi:hypothetical protein